MDAAREVFFQSLMQDADQVLGEMFIQAVRDKKASLVKSLLNRPCLWGKYTDQLTAEEKNWLSQQMM